MNARDALNHPPAEIHRQDYRPPSHRISKVSLDFTLDLTATRVINEFTFHRNGSAKDLHLHGDELGFVSLALDGRVLEPSAFEVSPQHLVIFDVPEQGVLRVETMVNPKANTALMGLYASRGGLFTQCESEGFRRITYFLDRPDVMAVYDVTMRGLKSEFPVMLSNGNLIHERDLPGGMHEARWQDPFPKPSYLFALVAAELDCIEQTITTASGRQALLQVYTRQEDILQADHAMQSLKRAIRWDEKRYGLELDLERFMIVAVPDFNSGAMENKGLNLFNTKFVLADPNTATDVDYDGIESVVAHEYFHNWTGNRITCRDWFQLTLKEGLTVFRDSEFSADMAAEGLSEREAASARAVRRIDGVRVLRAAQFPEDSGAMSHPIRPDRYQEIRNFYTATVYEKGAEVIRMIQTLLGVDGFRKGMDLYFARHDGQAVTCEAFVDAMFDANHRNDAARFMRWYDTSGTPRLKVTSVWNEATSTIRLDFSQTICSRSPSQQPLMIPVAIGMLTPTGKALSLAEAKISGDASLQHLPQGTLLVLTGPSASLELSTPMRPVPSILHDFSAPVELEYDVSEEDLLHLLAHDSDAFNRWESGQRLMLKAMLGAPTADLEPMLRAFKKLIADQGLDNGYKAELLTLPSEQYVCERVDVIDPAAIRGARNRLRTMMAKALKAELMEIDQRLRSQRDTPYSPDPVSIGRRSLANLAQHWLAITGELSGDELARRFVSANNMTDRMAALGALVELGGPHADQALLHYFNEFKNHPLALDKWFTVQVTVTDETALDRTLELLNHPMFDIANPNRVRSVLGAFFNQNLPGFHRADGQGYELWAAQVIAMDGRNSQLASRMARALDRWMRFEPKRRTAMRQALEKVAAYDHLSSDVREVVAKALG